MEILRTLRDNGPVYPDAGICGNIRSLGHEVDEDRLHGLFKSWPQFSGNPTYPVPGPGGLGAAWAYKHIIDVWKGEYGDMRRELLDHCIAELEKAE